MEVKPWLQKGEEGCSKQRKLKARAWCKVFYLDRKGVGHMARGEEREEQRQVWGLMPGQKRQSLWVPPQASSYRNAVRGSEAENGQACQMTDVTRHCVRTQRLKRAWMVSGRRGPLVNGRPWHPQLSPPPPPPHF